jgi:hypothetical protein
MTTKPTLLKEAIGAIRAIKRLNFAEWNEPNEDPQMYRAFQRCAKVLAKAAKLKAA